MEQDNTKVIPVIFSVLKNGKALRTKSVEGITLKMPDVGNCFVMFAKPLNEHSSARMIRTSPVKRIIRLTEEVIKIYTENSVYRIKTIKEDII